MLFYEEYEEAISNETIRKAFFLVKGEELPWVVYSKLSPDLPSPVPSPHKKLEMKQAMEALSKEAQEVLSLLTYAPEELINELEYQDKISKQKVYLFLRKKNKWTIQTVLKIMKELKSLHKELTSI